MTALRRDNGDFRFTSAGKKLVGWVRRDLPQEVFADFVRDPEACFNDPAARVLKDGLKTKVIQKSFKDRKGASWEMIIKRFHYSFFARRLGFLVFDSPAARCLEGALLLSQKGIRAPAPLAAFEFRSWRRLGTSYYITEEVKDSRSLRDLWGVVLSSPARSGRLKVIRSILRDLACLLSRLHSMGIYHRDLKGSNILIQEWESPRRKIFLVDLDRVVEKTRLSLSKRIKNLAQIRHGAWSVKEKTYFFMRYAEFYGLSKKDAKVLARQLLVRNQRRASS